MTEGGFDESSFYSRKVPVDRDNSWNLETPTGHNHSVTRNIPQYLSAVDNDCYGRVSVNVCMQKKF